jgi:hypothetical protein
VPPWATTGTLALWVIALTLIVIALWGVDLTAS